MAPHIGITLGGISPSDGPPYDGKTTAKGREWDLVVTSSSSSNVGGRTGGGGDICLPPSKHGHAVHHDLSDHGPVSGGGAAPWGKVSKR